MDPIDLAKYPPERIRNFSIIAHIDHGKSTLADRLLEMTGAIRSDVDNKQVMDRLQVERERGITVKAQTASIFHTYKGQNYLLNLIDTPGHVDFGYEVSCSLAACQGTLLVVDAAQGIQAQTLANFFLAFERELSIVPVMNKVDLPHADPKRVSQQMVTIFDVEEEDILPISAKSGLGCEDVLSAIVEKIPPPQVTSEKLKAVLFDTWFDSFRGVVGMIQMHSGKLTRGDKIAFASTGKLHDVIEVGILHPGQIQVDCLHAGQVGYVITGIKDPKLARIGDTIHLAGESVDPLPGFKPSKPMVFSGLFPTDQSEFGNLTTAIEKLCLNDGSVTVRREISPALGSGYRLGFLGMLHMEVFGQRLEQEFNLETIITSPSVSYMCEFKDGKKESIDSPTDFPGAGTLNFTMYEPMVIATLVFPDEYMGKMIEMCQDRRGVQVSLDYIDSSRTIMKYRLPLEEIVTDFFDEVKSASSGYATVDYEDDEYEAAEIVLVSLLLNNEPVDALSFLVHSTRAYARGKLMCKKLKETINRQLYDVAIQAKVKGAVVARETVKAMRKDVTAKCYGGDITRKKKLLNKQKEGKKKMRMIGTVEVPKEAFLAIMKRN